MFYNTYEKYGIFMYRRRRKLNSVHKPLFMSAVVPYFLLCCLAAFAIVYVYVEPFHAKPLDTSRKPHRIPLPETAPNSKLNTPLYQFKLNENEPFVCGDFFRQIADHNLNSTEAFRKFANNPKVHKGDIIFIKTDFRANFVKVLPQIKAPFILITHDSDYSAPGTVTQILKSPKLIRWFAQNKDFTHERMTALPIGLANSKWAHGNQKLVVEAQNNVVPFENRTVDVFVNFRNTNTDRKIVWKHFCNEDSALNATCKEIVGSQEEYLHIISNTKFVISPLGNGIDCHRTWESIALGAIPVVLNSTISKLYEGERVLIVNDFKEVTTELLEDAAERLQSVENTADTSRLYRKYWLRVIKNTRNEI